MKNIVMVTTALLLTACAGKPEIVDVYEKVQIVPIHNVTPDVGGSYYADMGEALISFESGSYVAERSQNATIATGLAYNHYEHPGVKKGSTVKLAKSKQGQNAACFDDARYRGENIKLCLYDLNHDGYFNYGQFNGRDIDTINIKYDVTSVDKYDGSNEYVKKQIIYRGFSSGKVLFSYLEYIGRLDKPTFEEEFKVDFEKGKHVMVGYKGARLKIMKADNITVEYQLIANFK